MDVAVSTLRAELSTWLDRVRDGEEVVVTERGTPVARLVGIGSASRMEQLVERGVLEAPRRAGRPVAREAARVAARGSVSDIVGEQRR